MINFQSERFVDIDENSQEQVDDKNIIVKPKKKNQNAFDQESAFLDMKKFDQFKQIQANLQQEQDQKDRKIKKLTLINKQLIQTLKVHNSQLSQRLKHQRLKIPKIAKNSQKSQIQSITNQKKIESLKKQLQNAYRQIDVYKLTIQNSKSKVASVENIAKVNQMQSKLKIEDSRIQKYHQQINILQKIKEQQQKQLNSISNGQFKQNQKRQEKQIVQLKQRLKMAKKNLSKRQQLQKKQHIYFVQLEKVYRKFLKQQKEEQQIYSNQLSFLHTNQVSDLEWKDIKIKLIQAKKLYQENRKKILYINHIKSKEEKSLSQNQLKIKQKERQLKKLQTKYSEMIKLSKVRSNQKNVHNLSMTKIQDLIFRQNSNQLEINQHLQKLRQIGLKQQKQTIQMRSAKKWSPQIDQNISIADNKPVKVIPNQKQQNSLPKQKISQKAKNKLPEKNEFSNFIKQERKLQTTEISSTKNRK